MLKARKQSFFVRTSVCLVALMTVSTGLISPASASNFGSSGTAGVSGTTNGVWFTNNSGWYIGKRALTQTYSDGLQDTVFTQYVPTDLDVFTSAPSSCPDASYDTCVYDSAYGNNGYFGWNQCAGTTSGSHPNQVCSVTYVKINESKSPPARRVTCHELGHSLGLRHTSEQASCVKETAAGGNSESLSQHDKDHINARY